MLAHALKSVAAERIHTLEKPVVVGMSPILTGQPEVAVSVNGNEYPFILDIGASASVLTDDVARACGVLPITTGEGYVRTATSRCVAFRPATVERISIGDLVVENHLS